MISMHTTLWFNSPLHTDTDVFYSRSHQFDQVEDALDKTLSDLSLEYLDLYLMHWPVASSSGRNYIDYVDVSHSILSTLHLLLTSLL